MHSVDTSEIKAECNNYCFAVGGPSVYCTNLVMEKIKVRIWSIISKLILFMQASVESSVMSSSLTDSCELVLDFVTSTLGCRDMLYSLLNNVFLPYDYNFDSKFKFQQLSQVWCLFIHSGTQSVEKRVFIARNCRIGPKALLPFSLVHCVHAGSSHSFIHLIQADNFAFATSVLLHAGLVTYSQSNQVRATNPGACRTIARYCNRTVTITNAQQVIDYFFVKVCFVNLFNLFN